jgi:pre-mRNA-splicing factor 38A
MEYITRQKIYDSRFWKEECFGMTAADVLEGAAKTLKCVGGTFGGNHRPSKFLCLTLKLLQLQPDAELVQEFIQQDHFKTVKALGAFYLRLTGRPADIYDTLEPLYADYTKLQYRGVTEWKLLHMDEFIHELLTQPFACSIALPRLPFRETLQDAGYLEEGPRPTALREVIEQAGGLEDYLKYKVNIEKSPAAIALWERRKGETPKEKKETTQDDVTDAKEGTDRRQIREVEEGEEENEDGETREHTRVPGEADPLENEDNTSNPSKRKSRGYEEDEKRKKPKYGSLFKKEKRKDKKAPSTGDDKNKSQPAEGSDEYWNEQRAKLGLAPLKK